MSICKDYKKSYECPALKWAETEYFYCDLVNISHTDRVEDLPDTCPYAPILKLLAEAKEVDDFNIGSKMYHQDDNSAWRYVSFWIRR